MVDMAKKNPAAVALGRLGGKARLTRMTAAERSEVARRGALARHGKLQPSRWWVLGGVDPNKFEVVFASRSKQEVRDFAKKNPKAAGQIDFVDFDPHGLSIVNKFKPDIDAQVLALKIAIEQKVGKE